jgi:hypothetical protein
MTYCVVFRVDMGYPIIGFHPCFRHVLEFLAFRITPNQEQRKDAIQFAVNFASLQKAPETLARKLKSYIALFYAI